MDVRLRGLSADDLPALDRLLRETEAVDATEEHINLADLQEDYADPLLDGERDWIGAFVGEQTQEMLVGQARIIPRAPAQDELVSYLTGSTHPDHRGRGIGTRLLAAIEERSAERHRALAPGLPCLLKLSGISAAEDQRALLAERSFLPDRYNLVLGVQPLPEPAPDVLPDDLRIRAYEVERDAEVLRRVHNVAFLDHPGFSPWNEAEWRQWVSGNRNFRPALTRLVVDAADAVVAYVQVEEYDADTEMTGLREAWIARVGVVREHRGKNLASVVLRHVLGAAREAGYDRAALEVDAENPTGALGIYERAGFTLEKHWTTYLRTDPPVA